MASEFKRPDDSFRMSFGGVNTRDVPDALRPGKFAAASNIRSTGQFSIRTRPGYIDLFYTGNNAITDIRGYATLQTDALPRFLARDSAGAVWLDSGNNVAQGTNVGNLAGNAGFGCSMIPFRPSESPQSWMYVGTQGDYQKFSAPGANNNVTQYKVGIAEPQNQVEACPQFQGAYIFTGVAANWNASGNANGTSDGNRSVDTIGVVLTDPVDSTRQSLQVGNNANAVYAAGEVVTIGNNSGQVIDVLPPISSDNVTIQSIRYTSGNNGSCTIVPSQVGGLDSSFLGALRRGALLQLSSANNNEVVFVRSVVDGPNGNIAINTSTVATYAANNNIGGIPAIILYSIGTANNNITSPMISSNLSAGLGTLTLPLSTNPFTKAFSAPAPGNNAIATEDDYLHMSLSFSDPTQLNQLLIMFTLDPGGNNFTGDLFYYAVRQGDLVQITSGNVTLLPAILQAAENEIIGNLPTPGNITPPAQSNAGANQWTEILFPISALTRLGGDQSKTLANCTGVQLQFNMNNTAQVSWGGMWVGGGGLPDVGNNGAPYAYQVVPLSSLTGVRGNPTPVMRYGVSPRRQPVKVKTSSLNSSYDPQIDTWEINRYGGSILSYRFIGTAAVGSDFIDNVFDDAAAAGDPLTIDNTQPWPTIDVPYKANNNVTAYGPFLTIAAANNSFPATMPNWLPGTIFQIGGQEGFTLRTRPVAGNNLYTFEFEECIGSGNQSSVLVLEPNVAAQSLPYLWGPNEQGYVFGCGGALRPGVVQWSKAYAPDASPTAYTLDLCPPSEPLLGGEVLSGISLVASSKRWWALYFQQGGTPLYSQLEVPVGKRLAAPFGKCADGAFLYFWATDGICKTAGGAAASLTDADLYNLFPHGGLSGKNVTRGIATYYAPDYSRAATFRLAIRENVLYALYQDSTGTPRMLIGELKPDGSAAWSTDVYAFPGNAMPTTVYAIEQPKGTLELAPQLYPAVVMGTSGGYVAKFQDFTNDGGNFAGTPIGSYVYPFEWDCGDLRDNELWGDMFVDVLAPNGMTVQPVSQGNNIANSTVLAANHNRQFAPISMNGGVLVNFACPTFAWTDNFNNSSNASHLYAWQPSFNQQVEITTDRAADWTNCGTPDNKFFQGIKLDADTFNATKNLVIVDADTGAVHALQPAPIIHDGRQTLPYSFATPFLAHSVKDVPQDLVPWRKFGIEYIFEPTPESVESWITQWTALGMKGYGSVPRIEASYSSTTPVTLAVQSYDGQSPNALTLPATGGATQRILLTLTFNKGSLYRFSATSTAKFQIFMNDFLVWVAEWGRVAEMVPFRGLGGAFGDKATI